MSLKISLPSAFVVLASSSLTPCFAQLVPPGASGSTTTSVYTQSVTRSSSTTANFSRDQSAVISGSNINFKGNITKAGGVLGGITSVTNSPIDNQQLFPKLSINASSPNQSTKRLNSTFGEAAVSSAVSRNDITLVSDDNSDVTALVLNPNLNAKVRKAGKDFDLAYTQSTPGLTESNRTDTGTTSSQVQTSLSVFTAPFIP
jgi:hypothetical protein